jgi:hypothetical protein
MSEYPEHDKLAKVQEQSQVIGEFLDNCGHMLCYWREKGDNGEPEYVWVDGHGEGVDEPPNAYDHIRGHARPNMAREVWGEGFVPVRGSIQQILAAYFEIDLDKIEVEKRQMLDRLRETNEIQDAMDSAGGNLAPVGVDNPDHPINDVKP